MNEYGWYNIEEYKWDFVSFHLKILLHYILLQLNYKLSAESSGAISTLFVETFQLVEIACDGL